MSLSPARHHDQCERIDRFERVDRASVSMIASADLIVRLFSG
jgi:hypothetical protein